MNGIFFDFDGVITVEKEGSPTILAYIAKNTGIEEDKLKTAYYSRNKALLRGELTHKEMWNSFCEEVGQEIDYSILEKAFLNITIDSTLVAYIKGLKKKCLIGMITDNKADRIEYILQHTELKDLFDVVIISADVHSQKTEKKIFEVALEKSGLCPKSCVFIDNTAKNLIVPEQMGFKTILFDDETRDVEGMIKNEIYSFIERN